MDVVVADKVEALKKKRMGPPGPCSSRSGSRYSMSRTCGPRDIISLVIPRLGDNRRLRLFEVAHHRKIAAKPLRRFTLPNNLPGIFG
jgi:hypothetical protein